VRIAIHDYAGHPFQFELSTALARRGHVVRHFYFADDIGPKGPARAAATDPPTLSIEPVSIGSAYDKADWLKRRNGDVRYGRAAARAISAFQADIVISGNAPLDAQHFIAQGARRDGAAFVFWMQDFYSLAIERLLGRRWMGAGRLVAWLYVQLEQRLLQSSDAVVLISEDFIRPLQRFKVATEKVFVIPNWGALDSIPVLPKANAWAQQHGLAEKFVFLYSGTLALKHNPELLWQLAKTFQSDPEVLVVLAAAGVSLDVLKRRNAADPQSNLVFLPLQPLADFPALLATADVVVALLEHDAGAFSVPSKVLSYLCASRSILLSAPLENAAARMVQRAGAGLVVSAADEAAFLAAAQRLRGEAAIRRELGEAGRRYAELMFEIESVADRFEAVFESARKRRSGQA
jgi:glycosyltransferase involved in cell wall biosynthesis